MKRILVALDGSLESEQILDEVVRVSSRTTGIDLLHVLESPEHEVPNAGATLEDLAQDALKRAAGRLTGRKVKTHLWHGQPQEEIPKAAEILKADLLAMTTHARKGLSHLLMGSVAEAVVRNVSIPVLLSRPDWTHPRRPLERILVAVDAADACSVCEPVRSLAADSGAEVILLQVVVPLIIGDPVTGFTPIGVPDPTPDPKPGLEEVARQLKKEGVLARAVVTHGAAADQILEQARILHADLIALSTAARKGLDRFMMGSVAEEVVRHTDRPVLLQRKVSKAESAHAHGTRAGEAD